MSTAETGHRTSLSGTKSKDLNKKRMERKKKPGYSSSAAFTDATQKAFMTDCL